MITFKKQKSWLSIWSWSAKPIANESMVYMSGKLRPVDIYLGEVD
jgi:hypothetical protein